MVAEPGLGLKLAPLQGSLCMSYKLDIQRLRKRVLRQGLVDGVLLSLTYSSKDWRAGQRNLCEGLKLF